MFPHCPQFSTLTSPLAVFAISPVSSQIPTSLRTRQRGTVQGERRGIRLGDEATILTLWLKELSLLPCTEQAPWANDGLGDKAEIQSLASLFL